MSKAEIGSISIGTLKTAVLLQAFADCLQDLSGDATTLPEEVGRFLAQPEVYQTDAEADELLDALFYELDTLAPEYCYFGAHPVNNTNFGFWISDDALQMAVTDGEIISLDDLPSFLYHVSDHGNPTLYRIKLEEVW